MEEGRELAPGEFTNYLQKVLEDSITDKAGAAWKMVQQRVKISNLEDELAEALLKIKNLEAENNFLASKKVQSGLEIEHLSAQLERERGD